jgi:hypothetical protein
MVVTKGMKETLVESVYYFTLFDSEPEELIGFVELKWEIQNQSR